MEVVAPPLSRQSNTNNLLSPELRVPRHEPTVHASQPCDTLSVNAITPSAGAKVDSTTISTCHVVPVDSVQNSLHLDESQIQGQPLPKIETGDRKFLLAESIETQGPEPTQVKEQGRDTGRQDKNRSATGVDAHEPTAPTLSEDAIIKIQPVDVTDLAQTAPQGAGHEVADRPQASRDRTDHEEGRIEREALPTNEGVNAEQLPEQQSCLPTSPTPTASRRQPFLKLFFSRRYWQSRHRTSSRGVVAPAGTHLPTPSAITTEDVAPQLSSLSSPRVSRENTSPHTITISKSSPFLYYLTDGIFLGKLRDLPPPATAETAWLSTRNRLITDLRPVLASKSLPLDETMIELELCMSGRADAASDQVRLNPSIWIRCGSKRCREDIRKAVADLSYLRGVQIHFRLDAPRFACRSTRCFSIVRRGTETPLPDTTSGGLAPGVIAGIVVGSVATLGIVGLCFFFLLRRKKNRLSFYQTPPTPAYPAGVPGFVGDSDPAMQLMMLPPTAGIPWTGAETKSPGSSPPFTYPTPQFPMSQTPSHGRSYNIPTSRAKQIRDAATKAKPPPAEIADTITPAAQSTCGLKLEFGIRDGITDSMATSTIGGLIQVNGVAYGLTTAHSIFELLPLFERAQDQPLRRNGRDKGTAAVRIGGSTYERFSTDSLTAAVMLLGPMGYGDCYFASNEMRMLLSTGDDLRSSKLLRGSDFALIRLDDKIPPLNSYNLAGSQNAPVQRSVRDIPTTLLSGHVSIVLSPNDVRNGYLLERSALFMSRAGVFETMKIHTDERLERGSSGAWVVRGTKLLGMIVAVYDQEQYAHMLPMHKVFADITTVCIESGMGSVVDVGLPQFDETGI
ncbi:hypothetical protein K458DRAFT_486797 [Lentithecium fluviatile CBS 122367]|uniref:Uncharacterized protein n=1 Tax=Lentithecium fluviatile CBS 122367 TaxID=1168545 RepID=A0A6G1J4J3_9PLEO|nr:hypothetical protein K458DRAFT_486797 [Lentithecium fluviatile CBS 122367]